MKKITLILSLCLAALLVLAGCTQNQPHSIPPEADVSIPVSSTAPADSAAVSSAPQEASSLVVFPNPGDISRPDTNEENSVVGTIDDVAMGQVYLMLDDGRTLAFDYTNANIDKWDDTLPGARIRIYYYGNIDAGGTAGYEVTRIEME